jgi:glycosyltransferase involved in cell wall biosynthesis
VSDGLNPLRRDFALVVPAFNEAEMAFPLIDALKEAWKRHGLEGEIIVVDDGSTDGTADRIREAGGDWPLLRILEHRTNLGKTEAMLTAAHATGRSVLVLFDADLQHHPDEIPRFLDRMAEGWDMVCGRKVGAYSKQAVSSIYNRLSRWIFRVPVSDLNSMKAFRREILTSMHLRHDWHRFFVVLAHARGYTATEIEITLHPRQAGESKYSGTWRVVVGIMDLVSVWFLLLFSRKPLLLFGTSGMVLILLGGVVGLVSLWLRFGLGFGFRPLLTLVLLLEVVGFMLLGFGLVAEMVAQTREEVTELRRELRRASRP